MRSHLLSLFKKIIYKKINVRTFVIARLTPGQIKEEVVLRQGKALIDITLRHSMICLDPFCIVVWIGSEDLNLFDPEKVSVIFKKGKKMKARLKLSLLEITKESNVILLLYEVTKANCYQLNSFYRFITLYFLLKNKTSTFPERKSIAALYSYPRKVIVVSYKEENYFNIFPMDIQGSIEGSRLVVLGLRTTNITLDKILKTKKLVICDTNQADVKTIYSLGKHLSKSPPKVEELPFRTTNSQLYNFPVPEFSSSYKEVEIIHSRKMGYHMLLIGRVLNFRQTENTPASLYHIHLLEFFNSGYTEYSNMVY